MTKIKMVTKDTRVSLKIDAELRDAIRTQAQLEDRTFVSLLRLMIKDRANTHK